MTVLSTTQRGTGNLAYFGENNYSLGNGYFTILIEYLLSNKNQQSNLPRKKKAERFQTGTPPFFLIQFQAPPIIEHGRRNVTITAIKIIQLRFKSRLFSSHVFLAFFSK